MCKAKRVQIPVSLAGVEGFCCGATSKAEQWQLEAQDCCADWLYRLLLLFSDNHKEIRAEQTVILLILLYEYSDCTLLYKYYLVLRNIILSVVLGVRFSPRIQSR